MCTDDEEHVDGGGGGANGMGSGKKRGSTCKVWKSLSIRVQLSPNQAGNSDKGEKRAGRGRGKKEQQRGR